MVKGYLLIKLVPGLEADTLKQVRATPGIVDVDVVFGQWDAIAVAEAETLFELTKIIVEKVRGISGRLGYHDASGSSAIKEPSFLPGCGIRRALSPGRVRSRPWPHRIPFAGDEDYRVDMPDTLSCHDPSR